MKKGKHLVSTNDNYSPAKLPESGQAAIAQWLSDHPQKPARGVYYEASHRRMHPAGWVIRRHFKRKHLRRSNAQYATVDRIGTQFTMLPMATGMLVIMLVLASMFVSFIAVVEATHERYQQEVTTLADILPKDSLKMYDQHGTMIYQMVDQGLQTTVPLSQISQNLINAEVATEDQNFWSDPGVDITGIVRAAIANLTNGHIVSGGSTITQQLIKNNIVGDQDTLLRKLQEIILAPQVTRQYTKQQIISMYLNTTYYGEQAYGADAAAFTYFDLRNTPTRSAASQLDIAQAAMLSGIPSSPIALDPFLHPKAASERIHQ